MSSHRSRRLPLSTIGTPASGILLRVRAGDPCILTSTRIVARCSCAKTAHRAHTEHETPRRGLRSVVLPEKDSCGKPEDEIVSASCIDGQEAARGVPGTAGQRDLSRARAEEQSWVITRARPDARKIPHPLWRETASIPPIRRAGRTQTSRAVPAPWHHGRISAGQGGASTAGGTLIHCLRRMARAAGSLVVAFCGTCNVHTNAGRQQFNVQARSGDVFLPRHRTPIVSATRETLRNSCRKYNCASSLF